MSRTLILCAAASLTLTACEARSPGDGASADAPAPAAEGRRGGPRGPQTLEQFHARIERGFAGLDTDGDGVVTTEELNGASGGRAAPMMARLDGDNDGRVTREEMAAGAQRLFSRMDANGDGVISPDERPGRGGPPGQGQG